MAVEQRREAIAEFSEINADEFAAAVGDGLDIRVAEKMVENAIGVIGMPLGVAINFRINDREYAVPMAVEEPSVIAAASHAAKRIRKGGGFRAECDPSITAVQIQVQEVADAEAAIRNIESAKEEIIDAANSAVPTLCTRGGGARDLEVRDLGDGFLVTDIFVDCLDAMGANLVNTIGEAVGDRIAELSGGQLGLRILSNLCDRRRVRVTVEVPVDALAVGDFSGADAANRIESASRFAEKDPYRATTHNKGIMNGVDAVVIATGNDWRAVEAGAHAYASQDGTYRPLATWRRDGDVLRGRIEMPLALGIVGGALRVHTGARAALAMLNVRSAGELAMVAAAAGLASNLAALLALSTEGIQRGHMALHHRANAPKPATAHSAQKAA